MASLADETIQNFMEENDFNPMIALAVISKGNRNEAQRVLDENPNFKAKVLEKLKGMSIGYYRPEQILEIILSQLSTGPLQEVISEEEPDLNQKKEQIVELLTKFITYFDNMDGVTEKSYDSNMGLINNFVTMKMLEEYQKNKEFLRSKPDAPKKLLRSIFCKCSPSYELNDNDERIRITKWTERDDVKIDKKYYKVIEILMNCYLSVMELDLSKISDNSDHAENEFDDIVLEDRIVRKIETWLESNSSKTKSANKQ